MNIIFNLTYLTKMKKQFFSLALFAAAWLASGSAQAWDEPAQVDGVYQIGTASELEWFSEFVADNKNGVTAAVLTADLDFTGVTHTPIGPNKDAKFNGSFDGQYHHIKNLVINTTDNYQGIFGWVRGGSTIKNFTIDATCSFTGGDRTAAVVATLNANGGTSSPMQILNVVNHANVNSASGAVSAFIGASDNAVFFKIHNCVNTGNITTTGSGKYAVVANGWSNGNPGANSQVWNVVNTGTISPIDGTNTFFRGNYRSVQNSYDVINYGMQATYISPSAIHSGELCYKLNEGETEGRTYTQDLSDPNSIPMPISGPTVHQNTDYYCGGTAKGSYTYSNTELTASNVPSSHSFSNETGLCTFCSYPKEDWKSASNDGYYHLSNATDVEWFSHMVRDAGHGAMNAKLDADIDFNGVPNAHLPIGSNGKKYFGHFDGQNHRIIGMVLNTASKLNNRGYDGNGFFGSVRGGGTDSNGTLTNEVIIENLIIDASCSIEHDNNFAAGVVAHINSRNDENSNIIIRNCGNEANVSTTGKNAAGILGCVESTNVGLKLYNLWNKGNIVGRSGESAAICAWTGQRNVDGEVDVEGCWNIGEVTGVDGNGYNLIRRNSNIVPRNIVDLCTTNGGNQGKVAVLNTADPIASGELCYLLNGDQSEIVYTQNLGTDEMPVYRNATHSQVYQAGTVNCLGAAVGGVTYNNTSGESTQLDHDYNTNGICNVCGGFLEPTKDGDYYLLTNAGNVEWLSNAVANGGGAAFYAKMMNDIDFTGVAHSPIGPTTGNKFKGVFDGQGYRIMNMTINRPSDNNIGFFGFLQGNSSTLVKNLIIDSSCTITANNRVGGLTGSYQNPGGTITIENVVNEATINGNQDAGGFFGGHEGGDPTIIVRNCVNKGTITASNEYPYAGALCCYLGRDEATSLIENFLNIGTVNGHLGGNIGRHNISNVTNLIDLSETTDKTQGTGSGLVAADVASGKLAWYLNNNDNQDGDAFYQTIGTDAYPMPFAKEGATVYKNGNYSCPNTVENLAYSNTENRTGNYTSHTDNTKGFCSYCEEIMPEHISADAEGFLPLSSSDDLVWYSAMVNTGNPTIKGKLTADLDMSGVAYTPIGTNENKYKGTFDGSGHIVNLNIDANAYGQGFISIATGGAIVKNLVITGSVRNEGSKTAGIIAEAIGGGVVTIQNCGNEATIEGAGGEVAAIVANNWGYQCTLNLENVYNIGDVSGTGDVSTICACQGNSSSVFKNVYNAGSVTGAAGGNFVRTSSGTYTNCYSTTLSNDNASIISTNASAVASGELCAKLGFGFRQNLSSDAYPNFASDHGFVAQIGAAGYSTMYNVYSDVEIPSGIEAYAGVVNGESLFLVAIENKIAASEPVVLKLAEGTDAGLFNFMPTTGATSAASNSLSGSDGSVTGGNNIFALAQKGEPAKVGFYPVGSSVTIPEGKAYLVYTGSNPVKGFTFVFDEDDATGISLMEDGRSQMEDGAIYNIAGQRISKMQKGINIVNGKKILK